jgi:TonB-linked SusC/RagA family outer membrane protein
MIISKYKYTGLFLAASFFCLSLSAQNVEVKEKIAQVTDTALQTPLTDKNMLISSGKDIFIPKFETTAAVSIFDGEQIMHSAVINPANAFYGIAPGLAVLQNAGTEWDNSPTFYIRGLGGLSGNSEVLTLVDGFERPLSSIISTDIENVQVLKDAAATALYGLRGANGVILVNTKKGQYNTMAIDVSYDHSFNSPVGLPKFVDAYTYVQAMNEARIYDNLDPAYNAYALERFQKGDAPYLYPNVDWVDEVFRDLGSSNNLNMSLRGGGTKARYYGNLNFTNNSGFLQPETMYEGYKTQLLFSKLNARINLDINITSTTDFVVRMNGYIAERNVPGGDYMSFYNVPAAAFPIATERGNWGGTSVWDFNPVANIAASGNYVYHTRSLASDAELKQRLDAFIQGLSAAVKIGYDNYGNLNENTTRSYAYEITNVAYDAQGLPAGNPTFSVQGKNEPNSYGHGVNTQWRRFNLEARANYNRILGKSKLDAVFVYSLDNYVIPGQNNTVNRMHYGLFGHYGYLNRYFVDGSFTVSGSNQLDPKNKYGYFPAVSGAWVVSEEDFLRGNDVLNFLKIRASWGISGRDARPEANLYKQTFGSGNGYLFSASTTSTGGMREQRYPNVNMTYEKAYKSNIGLDVSLWKKVQLTADAFMEQRRDILVLANGTLSNVLGQDLPYSNVGAVDNKGIELGLNFGDRCGDFKYDITGNFAFARSKVIESGEEFKPYEYMSNKGRPVGQIFGYVADGYYTQADLDNPKTPANTLYKDILAGDIKFKNLNVADDNIINEYDRTAIGYNSICPEIYYSAALNLEYKGIGVNTMFQGVANYTAELTQTGMYRPFLGENTNISQYYYDNRWTPETSDARFPRLTTQANANNTAMSTTWIEDRSFLKLRHWELYYLFANDWLQHSLGVQKVKLYVRGVNNMIFSKIKETDTEALYAGYPMSSSINLGFSLNF